MFKLLNLVIVYHPHALHIHLLLLLQSEKQTGSAVLANSNILLVTVLRLLGNRAKDTEEIERIFLHHVPTWKTHLTSSSTNEEAIAVSNPIPIRTRSGKFNVWAFTRRE